MGSSHIMRASRRTLTPRSMRQHALPSVLEPAPAVIEFAVRLAFEHILLQSSSRGPPDTIHFRLWRSQEEGCAGRRVKVCVHDELSNLVAAIPPDKGSNPRDFEISLVLVDFWSGRADLSCDPRTPLPVPPAPALVVD